MSLSGLVDLAFRPASTLRKNSRASAPDLLPAEAGSKYKRLCEDAALKGGSTRKVLL